MQPNILLVILCSNGDCLYATTIARQIKHDFQGCQLTWAISPPYKSIIDNNPYVDKVLIIENVEKNQVSQFRKFKKEIYNQLKVGVFDKIFIVQNVDTNLAYYDGCIRSSIFNAYPFPITVPVEPILNLYPFELSRINDFVNKYEINLYKNIILFEFAPQSGQINMTTNIALDIANDIVSLKDTVVILSSANKINQLQKNIIDGSELSVRETAGLTKYCTFLLGCSSGITWSSTSSAGKILPMVQLLNDNVRWFNPISRDFNRFNIPVDNLIELFDFNPEYVAECVKSAIINFEDAKKKYNQEIKLNFITTKYIVYNLLCYFEFSSILKHIKINLKTNGFHFSFIKEIILGFVLAPYFLLRNNIKKLNS